VNHARTPDTNVERQATLIDWVLQQGLRGATQIELVEGYCEKLVELGVPLMRLHVAQSAFHPKFGGAGFDWVRESDLSEERYVHRDTPLDVWLVSPLFHLLSTNSTEMRQALTDSMPDNRFPILDELRALGGTDYLAMAVPLAKYDLTDKIDPHHPPEGVLISWTSDGADGFSDADIALIRAALPHLALALKSASTRKMASDLLSVYLGRDAGRRVMSGEIKRGSLQKISAAILYFDLSDFTRLSERVAGDDLIAMLNDYFGQAVETVQAHGGNILKFMGDGMLAMFSNPDLSRASNAALDAAAQLRQQLSDINAQRVAQGQITTDSTLALHAGEIQYGNIGAENRLDFTVIGPAVNLTARLSGMHRSVDQNIIVSEPLIRHAGQTGHNLVSLGRYMLRGVSEPQELFTIYHGPQ